MHGSGSFLPLPLACLTVPSPNNARWAHIAQAGGRLGASLLQAQVTERLLPAKKQRPWKRPMLFSASPGRQLAAGHMTCFLAPTACPRTRGLHTHVL